MEMYGALMSFTRLQFFQFYPVVMSSVKHDMVNDYGVRFSLIMLRWLMLLLLFSLREFADAKLVVKNTNRALFQCLWSIMTVAKNTVRIYSKNCHSDDGKLFQTVIKFDFNALYELNEYLKVSVSTSGTIRYRRLILIEIKN
uniref:Uncharacterized protein n=1 Tax=Glossina pallidipes TaxID=7398 RepID=A0A1A9Z6V5_GLOPL